MTCVSSRMLAGVLYGLLALVAAGPVAAQSFTAGVRGAVRESGGVVPGVTVQLVNEATGATRETVCSCEVVMSPNLSQALHLLNGETVNQRIQEGQLVAERLKDGVVVTIFSCACNSDEASKQRMKINDFMICSCGA